MTTTQAPAEPSSKDNAIVVNLLRLTDLTKHQARDVVGVLNAMKSVAPQPVIAPTQAQPAKYDTSQFSNLTNQAHGFDVPKAQPAKPEGKSFAKLYEKHADGITEQAAIIKQELIDNPPQPAKPELLARLDASEKDAARYRWLREAESEAARIMSYQADLDEWIAWATPKDADDAVDEAMKGKP